MSVSHRDSRLWAGADRLPRFNGIYFDVLKNARLATAAREK
jgi:hypothetical protein